MTVKKEPKKEDIDVLAKYGQQADPEFRDTGIDSLNTLWGGGINPGSYYAFWGEEGCGKSTIAAQIARAYCKNGEKVVWIDAEKALNVNQKEHFNLNKYIDSGTFIIMTCDSMNEVEEIINAIADGKLGNVGLVVWDSETATQLAVSREMTVNDINIGRHAQQSTYIQTKMKSLFFHAKIAFIVIFQARAKFNIGFQPPGADTKKMSGGFAARHIPDVITKFIPHSKLKVDDLIVGVELGMTTEKNKFAMPYRPERCKLFYGKGVSKRTELIDKAVEKGVIEMSGAGFYTLPNGDKVRGSKALYEITQEALDDIKAHME